MKVQDLVERKLGKIQFIKFGHGGYDGAQIGISFTLGGDGWGTADFWGHWAGQRSENHKWTDMSRWADLGRVIMRIDNLLNEAKVNSIIELKGIPIEVIFQNNHLKSWRVLTEVV